jgi:GntR family transcriptional regulator/MocR family aminotransferase
VYITELLALPSQIPAIWLAGNSQFRELDVVQLAKEGVARQIIGAIKEQIHAEAYQPGDRLPSTRAFAAEWGASRTTVTAAYGQLIAEGYPTTRPGARAIVAQGLGAAATPIRKPAAAPDACRPSRNACSLCLRHW